MIKKNRTTLVILVAIAAIAIFNSCSKNKFVIEGKLGKAGSKMAYLSEYNLTGEKLIDSCKISSSGTFRFKAETTQPDMYRLLLNKDNFIIIIASPNERIKINSQSGDLATDYSVEGSTYSTEVKLLNDQLLKTRFSLDSLYKIYALYNGQKGYDTLIKRIDEEYSAKVKAQRNFSIRFIVEHLHSPSSIVALYQQFSETSYVLGQSRDLQFFKVVSDTLYKYYPESRVVKALWTDRNKLLLNYNKLRLSQSVSSIKAQLYPDIKLPDTKGDTISLLKVDSKLILVYFWSPLNKDCQTVHQSLFVLYQKYKSKGFELFNVALFDDAGYWSNLINKVGIPGINVIDIEAGNSVIAKVFNVQQVPSVILINSKTGILARDIFGNKLETEIKKNLK